MNGARQWLAAEVFSAKPGPRVHALDPGASDVRQHEVKGRVACGIEGAGRRSFSVVTVEGDRVAYEPESREPATFRDFVSHRVSRPVCPGCARAVRTRRTPAG